jgi:hypothetical protein
MIFNQKSEFSYPILTYIISIIPLGPRDNLFILKYIYFLSFILFFDLLMFHNNITDF